MFSKLVMTVAFLSSASALADESVTCQVYKDNVKVEIADKNGVTQFVTTSARGQQGPSKIAGIAKYSSSDIASKMDVRDFVETYLKLKSSNVVDLTVYTLERDPDSSTSLSKATVRGMFGGVKTVYIFQAGPAAFNCN